MHPFNANKEVYEKTWDFGLMTFDMWLSIAEKAIAIINKHRTQMIKSSKVFSEQLFHSFDYTVIFINDRICKYAEKSVDPKFKKAIELLFFIIKNGLKSAPLTRLDTLLNSIFSLRNGLISPHLKPKGDIRLVRSSAIRS